jgi:monovalent cation/hydrogen antiporter
LPQQFPGRDLIVLCAFCVVLGTLVIQGFTLRPLIRLLRFEDDGAVERELSRARVVVMQAAVDSLDGETSHAATTVREQYAAARKVAEDQHEPQAATKYDELRLVAIAAQRAALHRLRARGEIGEAALSPHSGGPRLVRARCRASRKLSIAGELIPGVPLPEP